MNNWGWKFCLFASILGISIGLFKADWASLAFAGLWWYLALTDFDKEVVYGK